MWVIIGTWIRSNSTRGSMSSMVAMSLVNRFMMRPGGRGKRFCQHGWGVRKWQVKQGGRKDLSSSCWAQPWGLEGQRWASAHEAFWRRWVMCALTGAPWRNPTPGHSPTWPRRCIWCSTHWLAWRWLLGGRVETKCWGAAHLCSWVMMGWLHPSRLCWSNKGEVDSDLNRLHSIRHTQYVMYINFHWNFSTQHKTHALTQ